MPRRDRICEFAVDLPKPVRISFPIRFPSLEVSDVPGVLRKRPSRPSVGFTYVSEGYAAYFVLDLPEINKRLPLIDATVEKFEVH